MDGEGHEEGAIRPHPPVGEAQRRRAEQAVHGKRAEEGWAAFSFQTDGAAERGAMKANAGRPGGRSAPARDLRYAREAL